MMEIRKQILGIVIGIFITISFIAPVYSGFYNNRTNVSDVDVGEIKDIIREAISGSCYISESWDIYCK